MLDAKDTAHAFLNDTATKPKATRGCKPLLNHPQRQA